MSRFVGEAEDFRQPGEPRRVVVASDLLDELGVTNCPRDEQELAVKEWLVRNRPHQVLAISLRTAGVAPENVSNNLSNEPRRTDPDDTGRRGVDKPADLHQRGRTWTKPDGRHPGSSGS